MKYLVSIEGSIEVEAKNPQEAMEEAEEILQSHTIYTDKMELKLDGVEE